MLKHLSEILFIPAEIGLAAWITVRTARSLRSTRGTEDMLERLRGVARSILPMRRVAEVIAFEMSVLYYSVFAWHRCYQSPSGCQAFTYHRTSGYGALGFTFLIVMIAETIPVHILVSRWSPDIAWILTNVSMYGMFWFVGDYRATHLRPVLLDGETLCIRTGIRWTIHIPRSHIVAIHEKAPKSEPFLRATLPFMKPLWIELAEPVTARGPYGVKKQARWISVAVDDAKAFQAAIPGSAGILAGPI